MGRQRNKRWVGPETSAHICINPLTTEGRDYEILVLVEFESSIFDEVVYRNGK